MPKVPLMVTHELAAAARGVPSRVLLFTAMNLDHTDFIVDFESRYSLNLRINPMNTRSFEISRL